MNNMIIPNSCNWWICGDHAYFSPIAINALFDVDINHKKCKLVSLIPETDFMSYNLYPYCLKYEDKIFCIPGLGECIHCYDTNKKVWDKIIIEHKNQLHMCLNYNGKYNDKVFLSEYRGRKIYEIDLINGIVEKEYLISRSEKGFTGECILFEEKIYGVCGNKIYCIDLKEDWVNIYDITGVDVDLFAFCYDGNRFWLSGYCKEIYVWNPEEGTVKIDLDVLDRFNEYHVEQYPHFRNAVIVGKYIWFIPFQQRDIVYIGLETYDVHILELEIEHESEEEMKNRDSSPMIKYNLEYIRENRYLGVYSHKYRSIFEIDTVMLSIQYKHCELDALTVQTLKNEYDWTLVNRYYRQNRNFYENRKIDWNVWSVLLNGNDKGADEYHQNVGRLIYQNIK